MEVLIILKKFSSESYIAFLTPRNGILSLAMLETESSFFAVLPFSSVQDALDVVSSS
jgi:hypothetical protein